MATKTSTKKTAASKKPSTQSAPKTSHVKTKHSRTALVIIGLIFVFLLGIFVTKNFLIAATVNGQPISRITVIKELEKQGGQQTLEGMITRVLIQQEADKKGLTVSQEEIDAEIKKIEDSLKTQQTTLDAALELQGMTRADLIKDIKLQLLVQKLVESKVNITDDEVANYLKENTDFFPEDASEAAKLKDAKEQLKQQKISTETQNLIDQLQKNAKTVYFIKY